MFCYKSAFGDLLFLHTQEKEAKEGCRSNAARLKWFVASLLTRNEGRIRAYFWLACGQIARNTRFAGARLVRK